MDFWYSNNRMDLEDLSVELGQVITDKLNEVLHPDEEPIPHRRWGTIREWGSGYVLDYKDEYSAYSDLSVLDIKLNDFIK
jgi:hypothetical protein